MRLTLRLLSSVANKRPFYVTTPIFYVNAAPHLGHLYSALVADAIQRFEKITNPDCKIIFSTGTDEHGTKIQQAASKANLSLPQYCDNISQEYRNLFHDFNIGCTEFVRTTEERHKEAVTHFWNKLIEKDHIYKAKYSGWYSVNDEAFVPETHTREDLINGEKVRISTESGHKVEWTEETNYMFRLSAFKGHLVRWLNNDGVITPYKFQRQLLEMLDNEPYFPDISVSRPAARVHWAIRVCVWRTLSFPSQLVANLGCDDGRKDFLVRTIACLLKVPSDPEQSIYVWLDALISYLTAVGYPDEERMRAKGRAWPADVHVVGKDILKNKQSLCLKLSIQYANMITHELNMAVSKKEITSRSHRFHGIYWPAFLMAINWHPPRRIVCHSHWTVEDSKMSKSLGNVVCPRSTPVTYSGLRYMLLREATMADDANYSKKKLINIVNSELADTLGNLASRCCGATLNPRGEFPPPHAQEFHEFSRQEVAVNLMDSVERLPEVCHHHYKNYQFYKVADSVVHTLHLANLFFETLKPWELRKNVEKQNELDVILHITMETLRICAIILQPMIPELSESLLNKLQISDECRTWQHCEVPSWRLKGAIHETKYIQSGKFVLFQRVYTDKKRKASA